MDENCLFCNIINGTIPSEKVYEDDYVLAFKDINPVAPVHVIVIPKKHIYDLNQIEESNVMYISKCMLAIKEIAKICDVYEKGYRVITNIGEDGCQSIHHIHFHLIGGTKLKENIV